MKKVSLVFMAVFLLFFVFQIHAQIAPQEGETPYGNEGTREIGLNGSIRLPTVYKYEGEEEDDGTTTVTLQPFFKYFFQDRIHAGAQLLVQTSVNDESDSTMNVVVFAPSLGYTYPLSPRVQVDGSINLGVTTMQVESGGTTQLDETAVSYGFSLMALSPLSESAVIGFGLIFSWTKMEYGSEEATLLTRVIPIQVSYYF